MIRYTVRQETRPAVEGLVLPEGDEILTATVDSLGEHSYFTVLRREQVNDEDEEKAHDGG